MKRNAVYCTTIVLGEGMGIHTVLCGRIEIDSDKINTIDWVGGRGKLQVKRWGRGLGENDG